MLGDAKVDEYGNVSDANECNAAYLGKDGEDCEINVRHFDFLSGFYQ